MFIPGSTEEHLQLKQSKAEKENVSNQSYNILDDFNLALFDSGKYSTEEDLQSRYSSSSVEKENVSSQNYNILDDFNLALFDSGTGTYGNTNEVSL
ncbi:hypothetical protein QQG55_18475 [Brugia pahangi]